jgi:hypothetical protein
MKKFLIDRFRKFFSEKSDIWLLCTLESFLEEGAKS